MSDLPNTAPEFPILHARSVRELFSAIFDAYRTFFPLLLTIQIIGVVPIYIVNSIRIPALFQSIITLLATTFVDGMITVITSEWQFNRRLSWSETWTTMRRRWGALFRSHIWLIVLLTIALIPVVILSLLFEEGDWRLIPGGLIVGLFTYYVISILLFLPSIVVLERMPGNLALTRAFQLGKTYFWRNLLVHSVISIGVFLLSIIIGVVYLTSAPGRITATDMRIVTALSLVTSTVLGSLLPIGRTVLYYDTRIRAEKFDQALLAESSAGRPHDVPYTEHPLGFRDLINIVLLSVLLGILLVLFVLTILPTIMPPGNFRI